MANDDDGQRAKAAGLLRQRPEKARVADPTLAPRRQRRAARTPDTWGSVYHRWLARGHDHGSAAYEADRWEARQSRQRRYREEPSHEPR